MVHPYLILDSGIIDDCQLLVYIIIMYNILYILWCVNSVANTHWAADVDNLNILNSQH